MTDTMNFGPEWLRAHAESGQAIASSSKFKLAEYRYGREEMLALFQDHYEPAAFLRKLPHLYVEETQKPISLLPLSEDEQRLMAQGVNSQAGMRSGRGAPGRGGRGGTVERGRGRGRGRGENYLGRGSAENGDMGGGFSRPWGNNKEGWEDGGGRKLERNFSRQYEDAGRDIPSRFGRSLSDNWRDKGMEEEDGDRRKIQGRERWNTRTSWRGEPGGRNNQDLDWRNGNYSRGRGVDSDERGHYQREPRESEDVQDWADDRGMFDSRETFLTEKQQIRRPIHPEKKATDKESQFSDPMPSNTDSYPPTYQKAATVDSKERKLKSDSPTMKEKTETTAPSASAKSAVSVASAMPSMPQGVTLSDIFSNEKTEAKNAAATSITDENALKWFYTDPQGEVQGPFTGEKMSKWFSAGYFNKNLLVKRGCDNLFQPLEDLINQCGYVPFLPGPARPPISQPASASSQPNSNSQPAAAVPTTAMLHPTLSYNLPAGGSGGGPDNLMIQQQLILQHQILQVQMGMRQLQMQTLTQLQEQESFKGMDPVQQQQLSMQLIQNNPVMLQHMQQLQQLQHMQRQSQLQHQQPVTLSTPVSLSTENLQPATDPTVAASRPLAQRSVSQPAAREEEEEVISVWGPAPAAKGWSGSQPSSVWDLDDVAPVSTILDKMNQGKEAATLARLVEAERKQNEELQKQQEELRRQTEALQKERERIEKEKEELERQRQLEAQKVEEMRRQKEEEQRRLEQEEMERKKKEKEEEEKRIKQEEQQRKKEEQQRKKDDEKRKKDEEKKKKEEKRKQQEEEKQRKQEEQRRKKETEEKLQQAKKQQEEQNRHQQEADRQRRLLEEKQEAEAAQKKQEFQKQQQEALQRLQQKQAMQNIPQLPSTVNWARQQQTTGQSRTLAEIQQEEEEKRQWERQMEELSRQQAEQMEQLQQRQQQSKSWASSFGSQQSQGSKTLAEIQMEEERQLQQQERQKSQQRQDHAKNLTLSQAATWGASSSSVPSVPSAKSRNGPAASVWGNDEPASLWGNSVPSHNSSGRKSDRASNNQVSAEFPALRSKKSSNVPRQSSAKVVPGKTKKEEEAVHRLFKTSTEKKDDFTVWCEAFLEGINAPIDIETFVSFLQDVDSSSEVHDYVRSYLGEGKHAREFAKQFMEKRTMYRNKAVSEQQAEEEESIWGPAPVRNTAAVPGMRLLRPAQPAMADTAPKAKGGKKKKKMQKLDGSSLLGFTVHKDPNRTNAGDIETL